MDAHSSHAFVDRTHRNRRLESTLASVPLVRITAHLVLIGAGRLPPRFVVGRVGSANFYGISALWGLILAISPIPVTAGCTLDEVIKVGAATDQTSAVIGLLNSNPPCGQCLMGCASAADTTSCGMACVSGGSSRSEVAGGAEGVSAGGGAEAQADSTAAPCTPEQLLSIIQAKDATVAVMGMMGTAPTCASCFIPCGSKQGAEQQACALACGEAPQPPGGKPCKDMAAAMVKGLSGMSVALLAITRSLIACCPSPARVHF